MRRVLYKGADIDYEFFVPKENLNVKHVRLMCCGILPISSSGVGVFLGFLALCTRICEFSKAINFLCDISCLFSVF